MEVLWPFLELFNQKCSKHRKARVRSTVAGERGPRNTGISPAHGELLKRPRRFMGLILPQTEGGRHSDSPNLSHSG